MPHSLLPPVPRAVETLHQPLPYHLGIRRVPGPWPAEADVEARRRQGLLHTSLLALTAVQVGGPGRGRGRGGGCGGEQGAQGSEGGRL